MLQVYVTDQFKDLCLIIYENLWSLLRILLSFFFLKKYFYLLFCCLELWQGDVHLFALLNFADFLLLVSSLNKGGLC